MAEGRPTYLSSYAPRARGSAKPLMARMLSSFNTPTIGPGLGFDLGCDGPALAEFLPELTTSASIADIRGQMALFERLASDDGAPKVVDVGHLALASLFMIMRDVDFAGLAAAVQSSQSCCSSRHRMTIRARGYAILREQFPGFGFVPVNNEAVPSGDCSCPALPIDICRRANAANAAGLGRPAGVYRTAALFLDELHRLGEECVSGEEWTELGDWLRKCFRQMRELDVALMATADRTSRATADPISVLRS